MVVCRVGNSLHHLIKCLLSFELIQVRYFKAKLYFKRFYKIYIKLKLATPYSIWLFTKIRM